MQSEPERIGTQTVGVSSLTAAARVGGMYLIVQALSFLLLLRSCSSHVLPGVWTYGALGPLAAVTAIPRVQYHSVLANAGFVLVCLAVLVLPFAYVARPNRGTLAVSALALVVWCIFGLGFSITHV